MPLEVYFVIIPYKQGESTDAGRIHQPETVTGRAFPPPHCLAPSTIDTGDISRLPRTLLLATNSRLQPNGTMRSLVTTIDSSFHLTRVESRSETKQSDSHLHNHEQNRGIVLLSYRFLRSEVQTQKESVNKTPQTHANCSQP